MKINKKFILISIISIILIIATILILIPIYKNSYNTEYDHEDVICSHTLFNEKLVINITPLTNIKDFKYYISFSPNGEKILYEKEFATANEPITHTYYLNEIEHYYLKSNKYEHFSWDIISGKVQNKLKNQERNYIIPSNTECKLKFELSTITKKTSIGTTYDDWIVYCTIKNTTNKTILSLQQCKIDFTVTGNMDTKFFIERIDFEEPLQPGHIAIVKIDNPIITYKNLSEDIVKEKYNNIVESTKIHKQHYSIVYEE